VCNQTGGGGHAACSATEYCDVEGVCYACQYCAPALDPFDGICPAKCGGADTYTVGDTTPAVPEADASGAIRDVIAPGCDGYNDLVVVSTSGIAYTDDQPLGESNRSSPRLALKLEVLAASLRTVMTAMGHPTSLHVLVVDAAYRYPPADPADASLFHEGRAALISLPSTAPSAFGASPTTPMSELMRCVVLLFCSLMVAQHVLMCFFTPFATTNHHHQPPSPTPTTTATTQSHHSHSLPPIAVTATSCHLHTHTQTHTHTHTHTHTRAHTHLQHYGHR
jgi:hypothetical protein